ncbi:hypothetical protein PIB30_110104, partial [Stylosanthes scabra]|nr:hypothetical protein [Stylosanthes scabra]
SRPAKPKRDQDFSKPKSATHSPRSTRICVGSQQLTFEAHVGRAKRDSILASPFQSHAYAQNSKHMVEGKLNVQVLQDPRICVEASICVEDVPQPSLSYEDPRTGTSSTHMRG